jgi:acyl-CoA dehydrogenase
MEVLARYGTEAQKQEWLLPLLEGEIRSAFAMTEPAVASSDATNIQTEIKRDGGDYVINGRKWWISGAPDPRCKIMIVMGKTDPDAPRHQQQSQILVPKDTPGVTIVRPMKVFGSDDAPHGHAEVLFENVRVPASNLIGEEGSGFAIAQGRLGPGRIHHCMRLIGCAQRSLELMCQRVENRVAFGKKLSEQGSVREDIAKSACEIEQARLLTLQAADKMDQGSYKDAKDIIAMIKIVAPNMAQTVIDRAMQAHGAMGLSQDTFMAEAFAYARTVRLADGPDQVHMNSLGKQLVRRYTE